MLDRALLRKNLHDIAAKLKKRGYQLDAESYLACEAKRKDSQTLLESLQSKMNSAAKNIGRLKSDGQDVSQEKIALGQLSQDIKEQQQQVVQIQDKLRNIEHHIPNIPHESIPTGGTEKENKLIRTWGSLPQFDFSVKDHVTLCEPLGMSIKQGALLAGSRFVVLHNDIAALSRALGNWMLDTHTKKHGYYETNVPVLVNEKCLFGTGQLPKFADDQFFLRDDPLTLIPTAEVPITNLYRDSIISVEELPKKHVSLTQCFRREAGAAGKDTYGMIRMHQFEKVELVQLLRPGFGLSALEELTAHAEYILQQLGLPYRVMELCSGDIGFSAARTYDLEVWLPAQKAYREVSSCSYFGDFQSRRMMTRTKVDGKSQYLETINGSGLPLGRTLVALCENNQQKDGSIVVPKVLRKYLGKDIIKPE